MKTTAKLSLALVAAALVAGTTASVAAPQPARQEVALGGFAFLPKDDNSLYNNGWGAEIQYRFWCTEDWALALAVGAGRLKVADDAKEITEFGGTEGTVDILPLGGDIVYNLVDIQPVRLNAHAGARYVFTSSDASCLNIAGKRVDLSVDSGAIWRVGVDGNFALTPRLAIFGAADYQSDIAKQGISTVDGPLRDNTFRGFTIEAGLLCNF